jgi:hypothetical protein
MASSSVAPSAQPSTREQRGIRLFRDHADEIRFEDGVWFVPSQSYGPSVYGVVLDRSEAGESCQCADYEHRGVRCLHIYAATIAKAKTAPCSSCGRRFRHRDLVELTEDHESLTWFVGDRLCRRDCAGPGGVL